MAVNRDKPEQWLADVLQSVKMYNDWFIKFAPAAFRENRIAAAKNVEETLKLTDNLRQLNLDILRKNPAILPILRMCTCPPIARDRLIGLADVSKNLVGCMELDKCLPARMSASAVAAELDKILKTIVPMIDPDIFVWLPTARVPAEAEILGAATVIADRLCASVADPIIRNAQEQRQLAAIGTWLEARGYKQVPAGVAVKFQNMKPGTYGFRIIVPVRHEDGTMVNIPVDAVVMPLNAKPGDMPVLIEAKSAGDFTNVNKRRKEEEAKANGLRKTYGDALRLNLFLCGYFDENYLRYEANAQIDWVWEHGIDDLNQLGL